MKRSALVASLLLASLLLACGSPSARGSVPRVEHASLEDAAWLLGTWRDDEGLLLEWSRQDGAMQGFGTELSEHCERTPEGLGEGGGSSCDCPPTQVQLDLITRDGSLVHRRRSSYDGPTELVLTGIDRDHLVFEGMDGADPRRVEYARGSDPAVLTVREGVPPIDRPFHR